MENTSNREQISPELKEKVKKNVLFIGILTIVMFFAGFTSAYIVMMSDAFWLKLKLPQAFWISTGVIIVSSLTLFMALKAARENKQSMIKLMLGLTLTLGLGFTYFQFKGWGYMFEMGNNVISPTLNPGQYGKDYSIRYKGDEVYLEDGAFTIAGNPVDENAEKDIQLFGQSLYQAGYGKGFSSIDYTNFIIVHRATGSHLTLNNGELFIGEEKVGVDKKIDLVAFGYTLYKKIGDFFIQGEYGVDYTLMYNNMPVDLTDKGLELNGKPLDPNQLKQLEEHQNMTSTFVYLFSFVHWLHLLGGIIYLLVLFVKSNKGAYTDKNHLQIKLGGIYWHFLGILWVFLFLFLQYIH